MKRILTTHFENDWCQAGTRKEASYQYDRWICAFTESGPAEWLDEHPVVLPAQPAVLRWRTQCPPKTPLCFLGWRWYHEGLTAEERPHEEERSSGGENRHRGLSRSPPLPVEVFREFK